MARPQYEGPAAAERRISWTVLASERFAREAAQRHNWQRAEFTSEIERSRDVNMIAGLPF
jgi:hypothetical protein